MSPTPGTCKVSYVQGTDGLAGCGTGVEVGGLSHTVTGCTGLEAVRSVRQNVLLDRTVGNTVTDGG